MKRLYFAYGSNMPTKRLRSRIASAKPLGIGQIYGKRMVCNKKGKDGSGKANLTDSPGDTTWGVLYEVTAFDLKELDRMEVGYDRVPVEISTSEGVAMKAETYISTVLTDDPVAYDWYKELMLSGAKEHGLPKGYINYLEQLPARQVDQCEKGSPI
jgi:gamma-glutamylcyclotransferase